MRRLVPWFLGAVATLAVLLGLGEWFLRWLPPRDLQKYLGDDSQLTGPFRADGRFSVQYRSWQAFHDDYADRLAGPSPVTAPLDSRPVWAMFGNSFVQAPGMLADTARERVPTRRVFNLARNEVLPVRLAQVELLLEHGLRPERVFVLLLPIDVVPFTQHSLDQLYVNAEGAITYRPRLPRSVASHGVALARLGLLSWVRMERQYALPGLGQDELLRGLPLEVEADFRRMLAGLAEVTCQHDIPVTVVIVPSYRQVARNAPCGILDDLRRLVEESGLDACDVREAFNKVEDKLPLFIPDRHFSQRGNEILLQAILEHLKCKGVVSRKMEGRTRS